MFLRAVTFNIRAQSVFDRTNRWSERCDAVVETVRDADVVCLQEAKRKQVRAVLDAIPRFRVIRGWRDPILFDADRLTPEEHGSFRLPGRRRSCTWCAFAPGFVLFNTHLDRRADAQRRSAELIRAKFADAPRLLAGDLNANERSDALRVLHAAGFRDTFRDVHPDEAANTYHGFTGHGMRSLGKIDHILRDEHWTTEAASIVGDASASDHFAVTADLRLALETGK